MPYMNYLLLFYNISFLLKNPLSILVRPTSFHESNPTTLGYKNYEFMCINLAICLLMSH